MATPILQRVVFNVASPLRSRSPIAARAVRTTLEPVAHSPARPTLSSGLLDRVRSRLVGVNQNLLSRFNRYSNVVYRSKSFSNDNVQRLSRRPRRTARMQNSPFSDDSFCDQNVSRKQTTNEAVSPGSALVTSACEKVIDSPQQAQKYQLQRRLLYAHANTSPDLIGVDMAANSASHAPSIAVQEASPPNDDANDDHPSTTDTCQPSTRLFDVDNLTVKMHTSLSVDIVTPRPPLQPPLQRKTGSTARTIVFIGAGGFGNVFIAHYNGRKVAVKQLHNDRDTLTGARTGQSHVRQRSTPPAMRKTSRHETSFLAELNAFGLKHENIVEIITFTCLTTLTQVVYEYVGSRTLARLLLDETQGASLPLARQTTLIAQISNALAYCHQQRLVHLDVKPHNVLLVDKSAAGRDWCKLADFGCSRRIAGIDEDASICGATGGTLVYTAPEILQTAVASRKADVYSLALTAWQVLSHETLFPGVHAHTVVFNVVTRHLRPPTQSLLDRLTLAQPHLALAYARLIAIIESGWVVDAPKKADCS